MKTLRRALLLAVLLWGLTLGIFHTRSVDWTISSEESTREGETRALWTILPPSVHFGHSHERSYGIPYLLHSRQDCPPYSLAVTMFETEASDIGRLVIDDLEVVYDDGYSEQVKVPNLAGQDSSTSFIAPSDAPFTPYRTQSFDLPDVIARHQSFRLRVRGTRYQGHETDSFEHIIRVVLTEKHSYHLGWLDLLLKYADF